MKLQDERTTEECRLWLVIVCLIINAVVCAACAGCWLLPRGPVRAVEVEDLRSLMVGIIIWYLCTRNKSLSPNT
jgi:hypothetical protein